MKASEMTENINPGIGDWLFITDEPFTETERVRIGKIGLSIVESIEDLLTAYNVEPDGQIGDHVYCTGYYANRDGGQGLYKWDSTMSKGFHNGVSIIDPTHTSAVNTAGFLAPDTGWSGNGCYVMLEGSFFRQFSIGIGTSGTFSNINDAIVHAKKIKPAHNILSNWDSTFPRIYLELAVGFTMAEQIHVYNEDLRHITIKSLEADFIVPVNRAALTRMVSVRSEWDNYPLFFGQRAIMPSLENCIFDLQSDTDGLATGNGSKGDFGMALREQSIFTCSYNCGFINSGWCGIYMAYGCTSSVMNIDVSGAIGTGLYLRHYSKLSGRNVIHADNVGENGAYLEDNSEVQCNNFTSIGTTKTGYGIHTQYGSKFITNYSSIFPETANRTIEAGASGVVVRAYNQSEICVDSHILNGVVGGGMTVMCRHNSNISAIDSTITGYRGLYAADSGRICATSAIISSMVNADVRVQEGGYVDVSGADLSGSNRAIYAIDGGKVIADTANMNSCTDATCSVYVNTGAEITMPNSTVVGGAGTAIIADNGSVVKCPGADLHSATGAAIDARGGSQIYAQDVVGQRTSPGSPAEDDIIIVEGSIVHAAGSTGTLSTTQNVITSAGIIFK